jgi:arylsulfatase A-like enzyme
MQLSFTSTLRIPLGRLGILLAAAACCEPVLAQQPLRPNIILLMADDLGWGDPSCHDGWIATPALDAMARDGLRFQRFYSASAVCSPTRGSCLTGRHPWRLGIPGANTGRLQADETVLPEVLDELGYATGHFGKWHLGTLTTLRKDSNRGMAGHAAAYSPPWQHGFDYCFATEAKVPTWHPMRRPENGLRPPQSFADAEFYGTRYWEPPPERRDWPAAAEGRAVPADDRLHGDDSKIIMDRVIPFIRRAVQREEPFFAVVWFHTPHRPLPDPQELSPVNSADAYRGAVVAMDQQIARLRQELSRLAVADQTMCWFCSDNGPERGVGRSGPFRGRKRSLYEGGVRVPGILVWPDRVRPGRTTAFPAVTSDYYPTIVDYLGVQRPDQKPLDGISLRAVMEGRSEERRQPIGFRLGKQRSWVSQRYKLISQDAGATWELYDLIADPSETTDLAAGEPARVKQLTAELNAWLTAVEADQAY